MHVSGKFKANKLKLRWPTTNTTTTTTTQQQQKQLQEKRECKWKECNFLQKPADFMHAIQKEKETSMET